MPLVTNSGREFRRVRGFRVENWAELGKRKRDFSLRRPTHSQERMPKKKSAFSVRNDGVEWAAGERAMR